MKNEAFVMASEMKLPELGENIESGQIVKVLVNEGDQVALEQPVIEIETGKATVEVPATSAGRVTAVLVKTGDTLKVGQVFLMMEEATGVPTIAETTALSEARESPVTPPPSTPAPTPTPGVAPPPAVVRGSGTAMAAPHVRQFAREIGVEVDEVIGSGPGGRVSTEDVKRHARESSPAINPGAPRAAIKMPDFAAFGPIDREALPTVRQRIAEHMSLCWETIPHVVLQSKADATELETFRKKYKERAERVGGKLTMTAILVKVAAAALKAFPKMNSSLDMEKRELIQKRYVHIGVATDTPKGLLVPVIRDADKKSLVQIGTELTELSEKARLGKLLPSEMQGASFTISNLGGLGIGHFSAVINHPEVAILAVGKAEQEPVWNGTAFEPRLRLPLTINVDHRLLDGADGARFLSWMVQAIEQPMLLALEG